MYILEKILIIFIALQHIGFFVMESLLWGSEAVMKIFAVDAVKSEIMKVTMINQGVYNLFLAAGFIWSFAAKNNARPIRFFFLGCVFVAGIVGGFSAKFGIFLLQGLPAAMALFLVYLNFRNERKV